MAKTQTRTCVINKIMITWGFPQAHLFLDVTIKCPTAVFVRAQWPIKREATKSALQIGWGSSGDKQTLVFVAQR